mgnify:CR=1 FL=1
MAKRYVDTQLYKHSWFRKLNPKMKCVWIYLMTNCDHAGIYDVDVELMSFMIGSKVTEKEIFEHLGDQISVLNNGSTKWYLVKFVKFQYGELKDTNNAHKSVLKQLNKYDIDLEASEALPRGSSAYKDKDKEQDIVKEKEKGKEEIKKMANSTDVIDMTDPNEFYRILEKKKDKTKIGYRYVRFCNEVSSFHDQYDKDMRVAFKKYWTETNPSGTKMRFEMQKTWNTALRLARWDSNNFNQPQKEKKKLTDFNKDTTGFPMGYCAKCGESSSYKDNEILYGDSRCCSAEILPRRKERVA